jgi:DNA-binding transcriptional regulator YiaG
MTQEEVAEVFGLAGRNAVSRWETGRRNPNETARRLLRLLNEVPKSEAKHIMERLKRYGSKK